MRGAFLGGALKVGQGAAPAAGRHAGLGRPGAPPGGHYEPPARSWLTVTRCVAESVARARKKPQAERREARLLDRKRRRRTSQVRRGGSPPPQGPRRPRIFPALRPLASGNASKRI